MEVERSCFTAPWSENTFYREITENPYALYLVAMAGEEVAGYAGSWLVLDESHVTNIAVAPNWRRKGIAKRLMEHLMQTSLHQGANRITLEVRRTNEGAQKLYEDFGFHMSGVRKGYYTDNNEDGLIMWMEDIAQYFDGKEEGNG
jgi:ribosomal-protein-alanine N-acetyltransferase